MDKVRYASLKFKIWEDKQYKIEKQKKNINLNDIKLEGLKKTTSI